MWRLIDRMNVSRIGSKIKQSEARHLYDLSKKYNDVIDLTLGDPDVPTPKNICDAGIKAINQGKTKYTANAGLFQLRDAISDDICERGGYCYRADDQIIVTTGAMGALYLLIKSVVNEGDEVIIPTPAWVNYSQMVMMSGGKAVMVPTDSEFNISLYEIERYITDRSRAIIINTPCNPTGRIIESEIIKSLINLCEKNDMILIADEAYRGIVFENCEFESVANLADGSSNVFLVDSFSKRFSMTGWRVGYAVGDDRVIAAMTRLQENVNACCSEPSQYAAIEALRGGDNIVRKLVETYRIRKNLLIKNLKYVKGISWIEPQGTFYVFVNISQTGLTSADFAYKLLKEQHVAVVPGITYGENGEGYIRVALTRDESDILEATDRLRQFMENMGV